MLISSRSNSKVKLIRNLAQRKHRAQTGLFFIGGPHLVIEALETGAQIHYLVAAPEAMERIPAPLLARISKLGAGLSTINLTTEVFADLVDRNDRCLGIGAVVQQEWLRLQDVQPKEKDLWLAVSSVRYPANVGTMMRISDAVQSSGLFLIDDTTDPYDPAAVRASQGAIFTQKLVRTTTSELADWKACSGYNVIGTSPAGPSDYRAARYALPCVLFMGCESTGLTPQQLALCDQTVRIPMAGRCDSHNVAVASALVAYEAYAQNGVS